MQRFFGRRGQKRIPSAKNAPWDVLSGLSPRSLRLRASAFRLAASSAANGPLSAAVRGLRVLSPVASAPGLPGGQPRDLYGRGIPATAPAGIRASTHRAIFASIHPRGNASPRQPIPCVAAPSLDVRQRTPKGQQSVVGVHIQASLIPQRHQMAKPLYNGRRRR